MLKGCMILTKMGNICKIKKKMTYCSQLILLQFLIKLILSAYELSFTLFYL